MQRSSRRSQSDGLNPFTLEKKTPNELRKLCDDRTLSTEGSKSQLVDRLKEHIILSKNLTHAQNLPDEIKVPKKETPKIVRKKVLKSAPSKDVDDSDSNDDATTLGSMAKAMEINHLPSTDLDYLDDAVKAMPDMDSAFIEYRDKIGQTLKENEATTPKDFMPPIRIEYVHKPAEPKKLVEPPKAEQKTETVVDKEIDEPTTSESVPKPVEDIDTEDVQSSQAPLSEAIGDADDSDFTDNPLVIVEEPEVSKAELQVPATVQQEKTIVKPKPPPKRIKKEQPLDKTSISAKPKGRPPKVPKTKRVEDEIGIEREASVDEQKKGDDSIDSVEGVGGGRPKRTPKPSRRSLESMESRKDYAEFKEDKHANAESVPVASTEDKQSSDKNVESSDDGEDSKPLRQIIPVKIVSPKKVEDAVEKKIKTEKTTEEEERERKERRRRKRKREQKRLAHLEAKKQAKKLLRKESKASKLDKKKVDVGASSKPVVAEPIVVEEHIDDDIAVLRKPKTPKTKSTRIFSVESDSSEGNGRVNDEPAKTSKACVATPLEIVIKSEPDDSVEYMGEGPSTSGHKQHKKHATHASVGFKTHKVKRDTDDTPKGKRLHVPELTNVKKHHHLPTATSKAKVVEKKTHGSLSRYLNRKQLSPGAKKLLPSIASKPFVPAKQSLSAKIVIARAKSTKTMAKTVDVLGAIFAQSERSGVVQKKVPPQPKKPDDEPSSSKNSAARKPEVTFSPASFSIPHKRTATDQKPEHVRRVREKEGHASSPLVRKERPELKYNTLPDRNKLAQKPGPGLPRPSDSPPPPPPAGPRPAKRPFAGAHQPPLVVCMVTAQGFVPVVPPPVARPVPRVDDDDDNSSLTKRINALTQSHAAPEPLRVESPPPPPPPKKAHEPVRQPHPDDAPYSPGGTPPCSPPMNTPPRNEDFGSPYRSPIPSPFRRESSLSPHTPDHSPMASPFITRDDYEGVDVGEGLKKVKQEEEGDKSDDEVSDSEQSDSESDSSSRSDEEGDDSMQSGSASRSSTCPMSPETAARYVQQVGQVNFDDLKSIVESTRKLGGAEREEPGVVVIADQPTLAPVAQLIKPEPGTSSDGHKRRLETAMNPPQCWRTVRLNERDREVRAVLWGVVNAVVNKEEQRRRQEQEKNVPKLALNEDAAAKLVEAYRKSYSSSKCSSITQVHVSVENLDDDDDADVFRDPEQQPVGISGEEIMNRYLPKQKKVADEAPMDESLVQLDMHNADLHLTVTGPDRCLGEPLVQGGFALMWAGVKASYGVTKGKIAFQVKILKFLNVSHLAFDEQFPHDLRVGWSTMHAPLLLGDASDTYAYASIGKKGDRGMFIPFATSFGEKDVVTCCLDLDIGAISHYKNADYLGISHRLWAENEKPGPERMKTYFPHISTKSCKFEVNFGLKNEDDWKPIPEGYTFISDIPSGDKVKNWAPEQKKGGTVLLMCGLPGCGKSRWVRHFLRDHKEDKWNIISADTVLDCMRVNGVPRNKCHNGRWDMVMGFIAKAVNKLISLAPKKPNNYIIDQTNVNKDTRKRKLEGFKHFQKKVVVIVPTQEEFENRGLKQMRETHTNIPSAAMLNLKSVFSMPDKDEEAWIDEVIYAELAGGDIDVSKALIEHYNKEGLPWKPRPPGRFNYNGYAYSRGDNDGNRRRKRKRNEDDSDSEGDVKKEKENETAQPQVVDDAPPNLEGTIEQKDETSMEEGTLSVAEPVKASFWNSTTGAAADDAGECSIQQTAEPVSVNEEVVDWE